MDPDKSAVFGYDGVPGSHLDLAIPAPYVHSLCFPLDIKPTFQNV